MMDRVILFCIVFASMVMGGCSSVKTAVKRTAAARPSDFVVWTPDFRSDEAKNSYRITLKTPKNSITGLCFLKKNGEEWRGTLINEMGAKAFDFIVTAEKCVLLNVVSMMDKSYIKKTIAADLYFFVQIDNPDVPFYKKVKERFEQDGIHVVNYKKKQVIVGQDGAVRLMNNCHGLQYELRKLIEIDPNKVIL